MFLLPKHVPFSNVHCKTTMAQNPGDPPSAPLVHHSRDPHNQDLRHSIPALVGECLAMTGFEENKALDSLLPQRS